MATPLAGRSVRLAVLLVTAALSVGAVGTTQRRSAGAVHTVTMDATAFAPQTITIKVGDRVTWVNHDPFAHDVSSAQGGFSSKSIAPDASWTFRATRKGTFPYICTLHPTMKGTLVVE